MDPACPRRRYCPSVHDPVADEDVYINLESFGNIITPETGFVWLPSAFMSISHKDQEELDNIKNSTWHPEGCEPKERLEPYVRGEDDCLLDAAVRSADRYDGGLDFLKLVLSLQGKKVRPAGREPL